MDQIKSATLGGQHIAAVEFSEAEGTKAVRVAEANNFVLAHEHDGKCPFQPAKRGKTSPVARRLGQKVQDDLAIDGGLENGPALFEF